MKTTLKQYVMSQGVILGLLHSILFFLCYFINRLLLVDMWVGLVFMLLIIIYPIILTLRYRKLNDGILSFSEGFQVMFFTSLLRSLIISVLTILLYKVIDPGLGPFLKEEGMKKAAEMMAKFNTPQDSMEETMNKMAQEDTFGLNKQLQGFALGTVILAFYSLIVAAIVKKQPPVFDPKPLDQI